MSYTVWATRLTQYFFGPQFANQRVRLMVTRGVLDQTFPDLGGTKGFLNAVRAGPEWISGRHTLHELGLLLHTQWKHRCHRTSKYPKELADLYDAPPFLPCLCLLCLAWTENEDKVAVGAAFFPRLGPLFPNHDLRLHLGDWECLWEGLQGWTERHEKKIGHFVLERLGQMVHVGIPKSQVILTPCKVDRLPEIFVACHLQPDSQFTSERLGQLIVVNQSVTAAVLGGSVFSEIQAATPLGQSALELISEYLENWDGVAPDGSAGGDGLAPDRSRQLVLVLEPRDENTRWALSVGLEEDRECEAIVIPDREWFFHSVDARLVLLRDANGNQAKQSELGSGLIDGLTLKGEWKEELYNDEAVSLKLAPTRGVRVFDDTWVGSRLVESSALPSEGGVYLLISPATVSRWDQWNSEFAKTNIVQDFTWTGLPDGWRLLYLEGLESLAAEARARFPSSQPSSSGRPRTLRLVSGTRTRSNAARRIYASYDPPTLVLRGSPAAALKLDGATFHAIPGDSSPRGLPGEVERSFSLKIEPASSVVIATAFEDEKQVGAVSFGVLRESAIAAAAGTAAAPEIGPLGEFRSDKGIHGAVVPNTGQEWRFEDHTPVSGLMDPESTLTHGAFKFLESLHVDNNEGRLTFQEFRRRAFAITGIEPWRLYQESRWLAQLGFIEIQTDSWGRWSHVYANPLHFYSLPNSSQGKRQVVLTGCGATNVRRGILAVAGQLECEVHVHDNGCRIVPPRLALAHREPEAFDMLASDLKLGWGAQPASVHLANWAQGLDLWLESLTWHSGEGPRSIAEYVPSQYRITGESAHHAPYRLLCIEDPYTRSHRWHALFHNDAIGGGGLQHAFVRDSAWGMWKAQNSVADFDVSELTLLPYDPIRQLLVIPYQLLFPNLLGRALSLCSGLVPTLVYNQSAFSTRTSGIVPDDSPLYSGACWQYNCVPRKIAEQIASKVDAELKLMNIP